MGVLKEQIWIIIIPLILGIGCLLSASYIMDGYEDCVEIFVSNGHTVPEFIPDNCADSKTLLNRDILNYSGYFLLFLPIAISILLALREGESEESVIKLIKDNCQ